MSPLVRETERVTLSLLNQTNPELEEDNDFKCFLLLGLCPQLTPDS